MTSLNPGLRREVIAIYKGARTRSTARSFELSTNIRALATCPPTEQPKRITSELYLTRSA